MNAATPIAEAETDNAGTLDMRLPNPVPSGLLQRLQLGIDRSVQNLLQILPGYLQVDVAGRIEKVNQVTFSDFLAAMGPASYLLAFPLQGTPARAVIEFGSDFLGPALEILLGAQPVDAPTDRGPLTDIEIHILQELFQLMAASIASGWPAGFDRAAALPVSPVDPAQLTAEEADHPAILFTIELTLAGIAGTIRVAFPSLAVRLLSVQPETDAEETGVPSSRERMIEVLESASLLLEVVLPKSTIRMRDLMELKKGQVLALAHDPHAGVDCTVNGTTKFRGQIVTTGSRIGLQIEESLADSARLR